MKIGKAIEEIETQLDMLSEMVKKPLTYKQIIKVIEILEKQDKVITSLEKVGQ